MWMWWTKNAYVIWWGSGVVPLSGTLRHHYLGYVFIINYIFFGIIGARAMTTITKAFDVPFSTAPPIIWNENVN